MKEVKKKAYQKPEYHDAILTNKCSGQEKVGDIWTNEDESAEIERQIIEDARR